MEIFLFICFFFCFFGCDIETIKFFLLDWGHYRFPCLLILTFSLDLEHTDGVLRCEVAELAGGKRVASLADRTRHAKWHLQVKSLQEGWRAHLLGHHHTPLLFHLFHQCGFLSDSPSALTLKLFLLLSLLRLSGSNPLAHPRVFLSPCPDPSPDPSPF